jgi:hypothetical protein
MRWVAVTIVLQIARRSWELTGMPIKDLSAWLTSPLLDDIVIDLQEELLKREEWNG